MENELTNVIEFGRQPLDDCGVGQSCDWALRDSDSDQVLECRGTLIGVATSRRATHIHPVSDIHEASRRRHPAAGRDSEACRACRWFEVRIIRVERDGGVAYVVWYAGRTTLPNEQDRETVHVTASAHTVIELLTQRRDSDGVMFIPRTSRIALAEAAGQDSGIEAAWIDRAVS